MELDPAPIPVPDLETPSLGGLRGALVGALRGPSVLVRVERGLFLVAVLSLGWCAWTVLDAARYERVQERRLDQLRISRPVPPPNPGRPWRAAAARAEARESGLVGRLELSRLGLTAIVTEGTNGRTLRRSVGHVPGTAFPGEKGNVVLAAHRDRHFRPLRHVRRGDLVRLTTPDGAFEYQVDLAMVVDPQSTDLVQPDHSSPVLTLVTCYPFHFVGDAPQRFIVRARLADPSS